MRRLAALLALCLAACRSSSAAPSGAPDAGGDPSTLTLATYNVLYSLATKRPGQDPSRWADPDTFRRIQSLGADVILFQETNEAWEGAIRAAVSGRLPHCSFQRPKRYLPEGLGLCARYPIDDFTILESPVGWFPAARARVRTPGGPVEILDVHLRPAVAGPEGWWQVHRETRPPRKQEIDAYLGRFTKGVPRIIAGDFNDLPEGDLFRSLEAAGFENALPRAGERAITWRWVGLAKPLEAQLDHVAFDASAFELVSAEVPKGGNSDHLPVVVTLRRRPR